MAQTAEVDSPSPSTEPSYTPDPNTIKAASSESTDVEKDGSEKAPGSSALEVATVTEAKSLHFIMTIIFLCMVSAVGSMDSVIVAMCLSSISEDIGTTSVESFWLGTGFLLTQTVTIPIYGTLSDIFGRKPMVLIGVGTFFAASILCATAQNATWLIAARAVQGLGAGGLISLCQVIISDITTMQERGKYITFAAFAWAVGIFLGVPMGGLIAEYTTWRWVFWINLPPCGIAILGLWWSLHLQTDTSSFRSKLARVDYLGLILFTGASCSLLIGITCGGTVNPWNSASTIVPIILSAVLYAAFIVVESKLAVSPMIPLRIFQDRTANSAYIGAFFHGMIVWCFSYYIIVFFLGAKSEPELRAAVSTIPGFAFTSPSAIAAGIILKKTLRFKHLIIFAWILLTAGIGANISMLPDSSDAVLYAPRLVSAIGGGILFPTVMFAVQIKQRGEDVGIATSIQVFLRSAGGAFGVAIGGAIITNRWDLLVSSSDIPNDYRVPSNMAEKSYAMIANFPPEVRNSYQWIFAQALQTMWAVMCGMSAVGLAASFLARDWTLTGGLAGKQNFLHRKKNDGVEA